ncbi:hypothetical protein ACB371_22130, partial [Klebsiella pneumoniae]
LIYSLGIQAVLTDPTEMPSVVFAFLVKRFRVSCAASPEIDGTRRLGVTLAVADSVEEAVARAKAAAAAVIVEG